MSVKSLLVGLVVEVKNLNSGAVPPALLPVAATVTYVELLVHHPVVLETLQDKSVVVGGATAEDVKLVLDPLQIVAGVPVAVTVVGRGLIDTGIATEVLAGQPESVAITETSPPEEPEVRLIEFVVELPDHPDGKVHA